MKTELTIEQSQRLIELGVNPDLASKKVIKKYQITENEIQYAIFSLTDLLEILPKHIIVDDEECYIRYSVCSMGEWEATYDPERWLYANRADVAYADELIDALYKLLIWVISNRLIKFRGKDLATRKWVYGNLLLPITSCRIVNYTEIEVDGVKRANYHYYDVDPDTVGQSTSLLDRTGKEIYEDDIVLAYQSPLPHVVKWYNGEYIIDYPRTKDCESLYRASRHSTIIGNIHDNPGLIKEKMI